MSIFRKLKLVFGITKPPRSKEFFLENEQIELEDLLYSYCSSLNVQYLKYGNNHYIINNGEIEVLNVHKIEDKLMEALVSFNNKKNKPKAKSKPKAKTNSKKSK